MDFPLSLPASCPQVSPSWPSQLCLHCAQKWYPQSAHVASSQWAIPPEVHRGHHTNPGVLESSISSDLWVRVCNSVSSPATWRELRAAASPTGVLHTGHPRVSKVAPSSSCAANHPMRVSKQHRWHIQGVGARACRSTTRTRPHSTRSPVQERRWDIRRTREARQGRAAAHGQT